MTSFRNLRSSADGGNGRATRQLSDDAVAHRLYNLARSAYAAEGITLVASPSTGDLFGLHADPRDAELEQQLQSLEVLACRLIAKKLAQPENRQHAETLALDGCLDVMLGGGCRLLAVDPPLEFLAELRALLLRSPQGLRLARWQANLIADIIGSLNQRLEIHCAEALPIGLARSDTPLTASPPAHDISLVRRLMHEGGWYGSLRVVLTVGVEVMPDGCPDCDAAEAEAFRDDVARYSHVIERTCRAFLRLRGVPASRLADGVELRLFDGDQAGAMVILPTYRQAAEAQRALLLSPAGLRLRRTRADDIALLLEELATISRVRVVPL